MNDARVVMLACAILIAGSNAQAREAGSCMGYRIVGSCLADAVKEFVISRNVDIQTLSERLLEMTALEYLRDFDEAHYEALNQDIERCMEIIKLYQDYE